MKERIPMRWPAEWTDPARLKLLHGTPINCLVGETPPPFPLGDLEFVRLDPNNPPDGVVPRKGLWPGVQARRENRDTVEAGPTGDPWVDSNASLVLLTQAFYPGKKVWLSYRAPLPDEVIPFRRFPLPVADAEAYGAHWVIDLHDSLRQGLEQSRPEAVEAWKKMMSLLGFSARHREWQTWKPVAALGVISDFQGPNEFLSKELLNLAARSHLAYRIIRKDKALEASLNGLKAVLYIDSNPPGAGLREHLLRFARDGGLLIVPRKPASVEGTPKPARSGYLIYQVGKGRVGVPREKWYDPYVLAADVHLLLSHRYDVVRVWNGGLTNVRLLSSADGRKAVAHLVEYGLERARYRDVTLGFAGIYETARVVTLDKEQTVRPVRTRLGIEVALPRFEVYAAIELGS